MLFKKKEETEKTSNAILYPDKIVIETKNKSGGGSYYTTDNVTVLPLDASTKEIGFLVKKHLSDSIFKPVMPHEQKQIRDNYKKKLKVTTEKALMKMQNAWPLILKEALLH